MHVTEVSKSLTGGDWMEDACEIVVLSDKWMKTLQSRHWASQTVVLAVTILTHDHDFHLNKRINP